VSRRAARTRIRADRRGRRAESFAAWLLRLKGYAVLARRRRTAHGELDIVARRGGVLAVVEVKARDGLAPALDAVTPTQRQRIARAAETYRAGHPDLAGLQVRFDVIVILPWRWPMHIIDAWRP